MSEITITVEHSDTEKEVEIEVETWTDAEEVCEALGVPECDEVTDWVIVDYDLPEEINIIKTPRLEELVTLAELLDDYPSMAIHAALDQLGGASYDLSFVYGVEDWMRGQPGVYSSEVAFARSQLEDLGLGNNERFFDFQGWFDESHFDSVEVDGGVFILDGDRC